MSESTKDAVIMKEDATEVMDGITELATDVAEEEQFQLTPEQMEQFQQLVKDMISKQNYRTCDKQNKINTKRKSRKKTKAQKQSRRQNRK